ncbi:MAG TPA: FAD:protein FMN transferase [Streptosporangiaceae bacterium]|nr:FAD:protein FMN transferase [Streptosporangiaceae bacterium]
MSRRGLLSHAEPVMGTVVSFALCRGDRSGPDLQAALRAACAVLHDADRVFSTWDPGSPLSRLRRGGAGTAQPPAMAEVQAACEQARDASGGWFDPWALPGGYDPTGLVKGWAVDRALRTLDQAGVPAALVNGGGDLAAFGQPGPGRCWRAGIRHPWRATGLAAVIEVHGAVATSASYERGAHLIDPRTGQPASRAASATVTGPSLAQADALATGLAVGGDAALEVISGLPGYQAYLIRADGTEACTQGMVFAGTGAGPAGPE